MIRCTLFVVGCIILLSAPVFAASANGKAVYQESCAMCHDSGLAGAPKFGDEGDWHERLEKGIDTLVVHALKGFNDMPAKGGNPSLSDAEVKAAVEYMTGKK